MGLNEIIAVDSACVNICVHRLYAPREGLAQPGQSEDARQARTHHERQAGPGNRAGQLRRDRRPAKTTQR